MVRIFLFFAVIIFIFRYFLRQELSRQIKSTIRPPASASSGPSEDTLSQQTLQACPVCNTYFNPAQGVHSHSKTYCNEKCASLES